MARTSTQSTRASSTASSRRKKLTTAATLLPLAIGMASSQLPGGQPAPEPAAQVSTSSRAGDAFIPKCALPFKGVRNAPIDAPCGLKGGSSDPVKQAESAAKNNFCAMKGAPESVSYDNLIELQKKSAGINGKQLADRSVLQNLGGGTLGEGKYVQYIAWIKEAHYSDVSSGEAVNCNIHGTTTNDIHIVLVTQPDADACSSTTAEMSPHYRPESWTPDNLMAIKEHPVRIQGHLFFDGSHTPCTDHSRPNPQRASLWEIHPVYALDVCRLTKLTECQSSTNPGDWVPLDEWVSSESQ